MAVLDTPNKDTAEVKLFVWDSLGGLKPMGGSTLVDEEIVINVGKNGDVETIAEAVAEVEDLVDAGIYPQSQKYEIKIEEGTYYLDEPVVISDLDEKLGDNAIEITGAGRDATIIKGSIEVDGFEATTVDEHELYTVNLLENGYIENSSETFDVVIDDVMAISARYPNEDGFDSNDDFLNIDADTITETDTGYTFAVTNELPEDKAAEWATAGNLNVRGTLYNNYTKVDETVTFADGLFTITTDKTLYSSGRFFIYNLASELDTDDEYYYSDGVLYVTNPEGKSVEIMKNNSTLFDLHAISNVKIADLTMCNNYNNFVRIYADTFDETKACTNNTIDNCVLKNGSNAAIRLIGTYSGNNTVSNCLVYNFGRGAISTSTGNRQTLTSGGDKIVNNIIHDFQYKHATYAAAVGLDGVGHTVENNTIYNGYHLAVTMYGNDMTIIRNDISNVCTDTKDTGAIYGEGDWSMRGNVITENYIHDMSLVADMGPQMVYLDNGLSGTTITKNVFENYGRHGVCINGGRDNLVEGNYFVDTVGYTIEYAFAFGDFLNWGKPLEGNSAPSASMLARLTSVPYDGEVYAEYEHLANILDDEPCLPKYNKIINNILVNTTGTDANIRSTDADGNKVSYATLCEYCKIVVSPNTGLTLASFTDTAEYEQIKANAGAK